MDTVSAVYGSQPLNFTLKGPQIHSSVVAHKPVYDPQQALRASEWRSRHGQVRPPVAKLVPPPRQQGASTLG